ncbi:Ubiquitin recognition factor in ER-associated degradation protein 1 [Nymphon striatum]|nr:Ubiquitin recognition factor in ER-associated degradation protein 1 [Nymphon striatum]
MFRYEKKYNVMFDYLFPVIMPPSALDHLTRLNIVYPMLFKLTNQKTNRVTHCGVLEFVADEGKVYLPYWMMRNLLLEEGGLLQIESSSLPVATFSKFQPQAPDFLDITNPKAVLENALRNYACLTSGDVIAIEYNNKVYELCVLETKPGRAVSIIECDMNVDFAPPVGYKEPEHQFRKKPEDNTDLPAEPVIEEDDNSFCVFMGQGNRLDGKQKGTVISEGLLNRPPPRRGIPDYDFQISTLKFIRNSKPVSNESENTDSADPFEGFSGQGRTLR